MNYVDFEPGEVKITTKNGYPQGWDHQYNGVAYSQTTVYKKLVTLGHSDSKYFDTSWWYHLFHDFDAHGRFVVESKHYISALVPNWRDKVGEEIVYVKIYHSQLAQLIEAELNTLNPAYKNFRILGELTEAYLEVSFDHMGKHENGYVLWENCD